MNKMIIPTVLISLTLSIPSVAKGPHHQKNDWAKVTHVEPITRNERVHYNQPRNHQNSYTNTIMGGIIGGAIGNAVGHRKKNKQVGAVVGSLLGASVGHSLSKSNEQTSGNYNTYQNNRRCDIDEDITYREERVGYHVSYRYRGHEYTTKMLNHPGKKIKVRVSVEPHSF